MSHFQRIFSLAAAVFAVASFGVVPNASAQVATRVGRSARLSKSARTQAPSESPATVMAGSLSPASALSTFQREFSTVRRLRSAAERRQLSSLGLSTLTLSASSFATTRTRTVGRLRASTGARLTSVTRLGSTSAAPSRCRRSSTSRMRTETPRCTASGQAATQAFSPVSAASRPSLAMFRAPIRTRLSGSA